VATTPNDQALRIADDEALERLVAGNARFLRGK